MTARSGPEQAYMRVLASVAARHLGDRLAGVYVGGSWALGGYIPRRSDLDVALVLNAAPPSEAESLAARLSHREVPCPARLLELVAYTREQASSPDPRAGFELNLNTGEGVPELVETVPGASGATGGHWFAIDRDILSRAGQAIVGPPAAEFFSGPDPEALPGLLADSIGWHRWYGERPDDAVLNACRALVRVRSGLWHSKDEAGGLAADVGLAPSAVVAEALDARDGGPPPSQAGVDPFLDAAEQELREASTGAAAPPRTGSPRPRPTRSASRLAPRRGIETSSSQAVATRGLIPSPSEPSTSTARPDQSTSA